MHFTHGIYSSLLCALVDDKNNYARLSEHYFNQKLLMLTIGEQHLFKGFVKFHLRFLYCFESDLISRTVYTCCCRFVNACLSDCDKSEVTNI